MCCQGLRIKRKSFFLSDSRVSTHLRNLKMRIYSENTIVNQFNRVKDKSREELLSPKERGNKTIGIPFIVAYHPHLKYLAILIQNNIKCFMQVPKLYLILQI